MMAYDLETAERIRQAMKNVPDITEKKMFGGLTFLLKGKMTVGIVKNDLVVRVLESEMAETMAKPFARPMDFTKSPMKEFVYISPEGFQTEEALMHWINLGILHAESKLK
ncbi:MAG: TfoX/Sxy family transcriptional regulator of competence genes [Cyclobacteriaceae bacterium]|jgi:TfoX/Sxy family transcriptional regulator of competence genes